MNEAWGNAVVERLAADLRSEFPGNSGYSRSNLFYMRQFFRFYRDAPEFVQQAVGQIPWGHNILIFNKSENLDEAFFYLEATRRNNWARSVLTIQMETKLFHRQGKAVTNFSKTLPAPQAELAQETLKDPYIFGFVTLEEAAEYALRNINSPIGVSDFQVMVSLPENLSENLPSVESIERELGQYLKTDDEP